MKNPLRLFLLLFFSFFASHAQRPLIDSLHAVLRNFEKQKNYQADTNYLNTRAELAGKYFTINPDSMYLFAQEDSALCEKIGYDKGKADALKNIGIYYWVKGNYASALQYYQQALPFAEKSNYKKCISRLYNNIASVYDKQGKYPESLEANFKALKIFEEIGDKKGIANNINNTALIYFLQGKHDEALEMYFKSLKIFEEIKDKLGISLCLNNIAVMYKKQGKYSEALENYFKSLEILEEIGNKNGVLLRKCNIADIYNLTNRANEAIIILLPNLEASKNLGQKRLIVLSNKHLSNAYLQLGKFPESIIHGLEGLKMAKEIGDKLEIKEINEILAKNYRALGKYDKALFHYEQFKLYSDSLNNEESTKKSAQLQAQYEYEKKEAVLKAEQAQKDIIHAEEIENQRLITYFTISGLLAMVLVSVLILRNRNKINKQRKIISQEREKSEKLLLNILPQETANELKEKGFATSKRFEKVSILFTDFKGFTNIAAKMPPEEVVENLNYCFTAFDRIVKKYHLEKIKTIGDAYMCAGGLPTPDDDNPKRILLAAKEMMAFMQNWKAEKATEGKEVWDLRLGIHTGAVVAGVVGEDKFAYDIWGDTVNTASRMESSGEVSKINISEDTYNLVKEEFSCVYRGEVEAKNKGKIKMYFVE